MNVALSFFDKANCKGIIFDDSDLKHLNTFPFVKGNMLIKCEEVSENSIGFPNYDHLNDSL